MRMTHAWAAVSAQNVSLKLASGLLAITTGVLTVGLIHISTRDPIVIDRACESKTILPGSVKHTADEISAFLEAALRARFDSSSTGNSDLIALEEIQTRSQEQKEMAQKNMRQRVWMTEHQIDGEKVSLKCDRMLSVGEVRASLPLNLDARMISVTRTPENPYGLRLSDIRVQKAAEDKK